MIWSRILILWDMRGAIIGDIVGSTHEFTNRVSSKEFELFPYGSTFTDDTVLTIAEG